MSDERSGDVAEHFKQILRIVRIFRNAWLHLTAGTAACLFIGKTTVKLSFDVFRSWSAPL